jgi:hypothetical protein
MSQDVSEKTPFDGEPGSVVLKCTADSFKNFIASLLGKPQTIGKVFRGGFDIGLQEIEDLHLLLNQRISQQNTNSLIQFTARIVFDDSSSVLLNSFEDLKSYKEVRPVASTQIHLSWEYLVNFNDRKNPEKQEIEVTYLTRTVSPFLMIDDDEEIVSSPMMRASGYVTFRIKHTARTWGADIEALLTGYIKNIIQKESKARIFIRKHSGKIGLTVAIIFLGVGILMSFLTAKCIRNSQHSEVLKFIAQKKDINDKIDYLLNSISNGIWPTYFFSVIVFLIVILVLAIVLCVWVDSAADTYKPSFILLTREAESQKERLVNSYKKRWYSFIFAIITSIITGVLANMIFNFFWTT